MDPFGAEIVASSRRDDLIADADQSRLARLAGECQQEPRPAWRPARREVRARRAVTT